MRPTELMSINYAHINNVQRDDLAQLIYATRHRRVVGTANVTDCVAVGREAVQTNTEHAGIILILSSFRGDEFQAIAAAIREVRRRPQGGFHGLVVYVERTSKPGAR